MEASLPATSCCLYPRPRRRHLGARYVAAEALRELRSPVLPGLHVPVDESLVEDGFCGRSEGGLSVQAGGGEAVEAGVEDLAAGEREVAVKFLRDSGVEAEGRSQVHEITFGDAGDDPVPTSFLCFGGDDTLLVVVEVMTPSIAFRSKGLILL